MLEHSGTWLLIALAGLAQVPASAPETLPATQPGSPAAMLAQIKALLDLPRTRDMGEYEQILRQRVPQVLTAVQGLIRAHPRGKEAQEARMIALVAASQLARATKDAALAKQARDLAGDILQSDATAQDKLYADAYLLLLAVRPPDAATTQPAAESETLIRDFVGRYAKTEQGPEAVEVGIQMADMIRDDALVEKLRQGLIRDFPDSPQARQLLRQTGKSPDVGKPFRAELTTLAGKKLTLPDDLLGKVVVIDFWATWCGPCVAGIPEMKEIYARYKPKGVEIVGVSLDAVRKTLEEFVGENGLEWIQTFTGLDWKDPTARRYGVAAIPSVWVVGRDGRVVSDNARRNLRDVLDKALAEPATRPETMPASAPAAGRQ